MARNFDTAAPKRTLGTGRKQFEANFRRQHELLAAALDDIPNAGSRAACAAVIFNRVMFVYFLQQKGYLEQDPDYLRRRVDRVPRRCSTGPPLQRIFQGLGRPQERRDAVLCRMVGDAPFINGGLFAERALEKGNHRLTLPDDAVERLLAFFDVYHWCLEERPPRSASEITPYLLGHVFEKYINQKQMGAYYTRDDVTGYIARHAILPALRQATGKERPDDRDGPGLLRTFWNTLTALSVLDPACGSGAFLFAALEVLEPLYLACLGAMQKWPDEFSDVLTTACQYPSRRYFVLHTIITRNLYGVDLMPEAVELCRLRLYLKLAAHIETAEHLALLPDLDTNIRAGNALTDFDWSEAFPRIMVHGGFDVIIGNPPYLAAHKVRREYDVPSFRTRDCPDVYAWFLERTAQLLNADGCSGMIVPLSLGFSDDFAACRKVLFEAYRANWFASFGRIPAALFNFDVRVRNVIHIGHRRAAQRRQYTTRLHRWFDAERPTLLQNLDYASFDPDLWRGRIPKLDGQRLADALERCLARTSATLAASFVRKRTPFRLYVKKTAYNWLSFCTRLPPCTDAAGRRVAPSQSGELFLRSAVERDLAFLFLNGKIAFGFWAVVGDDFHVARWMFDEFPLTLAEVPPELVAQLRPLVGELEAAMREAASFKWNAGKKVGTFNLARCRHVTDRSDVLFARHLGIEDVLPELERFYHRMVRTDHPRLPLPVISARKTRPGDIGSSRRRTPTAR